MIDAVSIPTNIARSFGFNTFLRIIISGMDKAVTAIMNVNSVLIGIPFSINTATSGIIPVVWEI